VIREAKYLYVHFFIAILTGTEAVVSGLCSLSAEVRSKHDNVTDLNLDNLVAVL
jgi:hypothetical protein